MAYTRIATDEHYTLKELGNSVGALWPFLADPGRIVQRDLDVQEYTGPDNDPMIPHTLVLKPGLVVHKIYNGRSGPEVGGADGVPRCRQRPRLV